jgi:hypothetical protein
VYSTLEGAKARAKSLKRLFDDSGIHFPLNRCQTAIARAGGFQDWHHLQINLEAGDGEIDADLYRRRLQEALPFACHGPLLASWDPDTEPAEAFDDIIPVHFFRDVWPYVMAAEVLHRTRTTLVRPGSGAGQKLRANMVGGVLLNIHGGHQATPTLDPDTLALDYPGDLASVFRDETVHPRFDQELESLIQGGVIAILEDRNRGPAVRILAPPGLREEVARHKVLHVEYAAQLNAHDGDADSETGLERSIHEALAALGVDDTLRIAKAIMAQHSPEYLTPSGTMLDLLSTFASAGQVNEFAHAYRLFSSVHRRNATFVGAQAPAMIGAYLVARHGLSLTGWANWLDRNPAWGDQVRETLDSPARFEAFVTTTSDAIGDDPSLQNRDSMNR